MSSTKPFTIGKGNNDTIIVTTILDPPYLMMREDASKELLEGNDRFEGYVVDILDYAARAVSN